MRVARWRGLGEPVPLATYKRLACLVFTLLVQSLVLVLRRMPRRRGVLAGLLRRRAHGVGAGRLVAGVVKLREFVHLLPPLTDRLDVSGAVGVDRLLREVVGSAAGWRLSVDACEAEQTEGED